MDFYGPLNDENKLQIDEKKKKNWKNWKTYTIRYNLITNDNQFGGSGVFFQHF